MDGWIVWLIAAVAASVGEILTMGFFLAPFALGATVAMVLDLAGSPGEVNAAAFAGVTLLSFAALRPVARRHLYQPPQIRTGTAALIGNTAVVLERIANDQAAGSVRLGGEVWTARAYDEDEVIEEGERVQVVEIRGATAVVTR